MDNLTFYLVFLIFFSLLIFVIVKRHKNQDSFSEYSVADRSSGTLAFAFAFAGRWFVGSIFTVWFVMAAEHGIYAQYLTLYTIGAIIMLYIFGKPISNLGKKYNLETQADFIELRYGSRLFKKIFACLTLIFWVPWVILELKTIGNAISAASNYSIEYNIGVIFVTLIIIICCYYGGVRAINNGVIVQASIVFIVGVVCSYFFIWKVFGGVCDMLAQISVERPDLLELDNSAGHKHDWVSATLSGALGSIIWPGMFVLIYSAKSPKVIKKSTPIIIFMLIPPIVLILLLGMGASLILGSEASNLAGLLIIAEKYGNPLILAILGVSTVAGSMSMCSAVFNVAGNIVAKDINPHYNLNKRDNALKVAKVATVTVGLIALWIATIIIPNLSSIVFLMYSFIIQPGVPIILGLCWRRSNLYSAVAGMTIGLIVTIVATLYPEIVTVMNGLSSGILGLAANIIVHLIISMVTPKYEKVDEIFHNRYK